ncbi:MAG: hypothetical protein ACP5HK_05015 [Acidilobus sp.]
MRLRLAALRSSGDSTLDELERSFREAGLAAGFSEEPVQADVAAVLVLTGGTERSIVEIAKDARAALIFYHGSFNSLAAASEAAALLREEGTQAWLYDVSEARSTLRQAAGAAAAVDGLRGLTITSFGGASEWLVYSDGSGDLLGARVSVTPIDELVKGSAASGPEAFRGKEPTLEGVDRADLDKAMSLLGAMRRLSAGPLTVRCFDLLRLYGVTPCLPLAILNSEGLPAGCEGDVPSLLTMIVLSTIAGRPAWMGNVTPGPRPGTLGIAHCTFPLSEASSYVVTTHFETGRPLAVRAEVREDGRATLAKYDPRTRTMRAIRGEVERGRQFTRACRTQVLFRVSDNAVRLSLTRPLGAHYAVVFDDVMPGLRVFSALEGIQLEEA